MIPDYLTFIRFQDKRNLIYIYAIGLILIGFYWKNAGFTFPSEDIGVVSGILALVLYNLFLISRRTGLINASRRISIFRGLRKSRTTK